MIKIENLSFKYQSGRALVLDNVNLQLKPNRICGLLGKNGVGKSTLLYLMAGLMQPRTGSVTTLGEEASKRKPEMLKDVFIVSEDYALPSTSLKQYVMANRVFYPNFSDEVLADCLNDFELNTDVQLNKLSMGQKKKVYISFALATQTKLLLMDEPTNGLDIPSKAQFRKVMARCMSDDRLIVISTHQVHDVDQLLDHVVILSDKGVLLNESVSDITDKYVFEFRAPNEMEGVIYAEPTLQGNAVMAPRGSRPESQLNLELLFNAVTSGKC